MEVAERECRALYRPELTVEVLAKMHRHIDGFAERERAARELDKMKGRGEMPS